MKYLFSFSTLKNNYLSFAFWKSCYFLVFSTTFLIKADKVTIAIAKPIELSRIGPYHPLSLLFVLIFFSLAKYAFAHGYMMSNLSYSTKKRRRELWKNTMLSGKRESPSTPSLLKW